MNQQIPKVYDHRIPRAISIREVSNSSELANDI